MTLPRHNILAHNHGRDERLGLLDATRAHEATWRREGEALQFGEVFAHEDGEDRGGASSERVADHDEVVLARPSWHVEVERFRQQVALLNLAADVHCRLDHALKQDTQQLVSKACVRFDKKIFRSHRSALCVQPSPHAVAPLELFLGQPSSQSKHPENSRKTTNKTFLQSEYQPTAAQECSFAKEFSCILNI